MWTSGSQKGFKGRQTVTQARRGKATAASQAAGVARDHSEQQPGKGPASAKSHGLVPSQ